MRCKDLQETEKTGNLKNSPNIQAVKKPVKQEKKEANLEQGITSLKAKTPYFHASDAIENKGYNSKYTPRDYFSKTRVYFQSEIRYNTSLV